MLGEQFIVMLRTFFFKYQSTIDDQSSSFGNPSSLSPNISDLLYSPISDDVRPIYNPACVTRFLRIIALISTSVFMI